MMLPHSCFNALFYCEMGGGEKNEAIEEDAEKN
jgi:hypothetical protein